jgi:hypothetical protein
MQTTIVAVNALAVSSQLERRYASARSADWRSFNWSRWQAATALAERAPPAALQR